MSKQKKKIGWPCIGPRPMTSTERGRRYNRRVKAEVLELLRGLSLEENVRDTTKRNVNCGVVNGCIC